MTIGSTIWGAIGVAGTLTGGIPFFQVDGTQAVDPSDFYWDDTYKRLKVGMGAVPNYATDPLYVNGGQEWYKSHFRSGVTAIAQIGDAISIPRFQVAKPRGTLAAPTVNLAGDIVGRYMGLAFTGASPNLQSIADIGMQASGASTTDVGGQLTVRTKANAGVLTERARFDEFGNFIVGDTPTAATNLMYLQPGPAGSSVVQFSVAGPDAIVGYGLYTKGIGNYSFYSDGAGTPRLQFRIRGDLPATNFWDFFGSSGDIIGRAESGVNTDVNMTLYSKGVGRVYLGNYTGVPQMSVSGPSNAVNTVFVQGAATGGSPNISAVGTDTNVGLQLQQKGTAIMQWTGQTVGTTVGAAGGASALPATPLGYITLNLNALGNVKIPYYN